MTKKKDKEQVEIEETKKEVEEEIIDAVKEKTPEEIVLELEDKIKELQNALLREKADVQNIKKRLPGLHALRGIAASTIIVFHIFDMSQSLS